MPFHASFAHGGIPTFFTTTNGGNFDPSEILNFMSSNFFGGMGGMQGGMGGMGGMMGGGMGGGMMGGGMGGMGGGFGGGKMGFNGGSGL